ncbi:membrane integrity-associated transporter subunit PqiC [Halomonas sp. ML-15]|uniref:PqiC family protein n=1 Tax=Halomonas sp. ML-15 TaxID=2773305 RepID=UPI00174738C3|nr:ABC-type transport auxiliary lipoprotein family protein [Halomonas sp. ML-15]MBD3894432.1 membrane integrity-associated transporter subunit PqiC [Halomonas sp. ML-15]
MPNLRSCDRSTPLRPRWLATATLLLILVLLAGCASGGGTSAQRYSLPEGAQSPPISRGEAPSQRLVVARVRITDYLDAEGIVMQLDDITLNRARQHLWAEDLPRQLQRGLRQRLAERLPDTQVLGEDGRRDGAYELRLDVTHFQGRYDGRAIARGEWQLRDAQGEVVTLEPFSAITTLDADGYPALVRALGHSWDAVADQLADRLQELR